jgi:GNAT superfamily N-acetyltransferase
MKHLPAIDGDYTCELLTDETSDDMAALISGEFVTDEPMYGALGISSAEFLPLARIFIPFCAREGLSFIARHRSTHEGAGFILAGDLIHEPYGSFKERYRATDLFWEKVMHERAFLEELENPYIERRRPHKGEILHIAALGVLRTHRGRGLATHLIRAALEHGKRKGFHKALADCTGPASLLAHQKCGFMQAGSLEYGSFAGNGERPFAALPGACILVERDLVMD